MKTTNLQKLKNATKTLAVVLGLTLAATSAQAATWVVWNGPYSALMSDTCVAPNGAFFTFTNGNAGAVNSPCSFTLFQTPGVVFYGSFR